MIDMVTIGQRIRYYRKQAGLSSEKLAEKADCSQAAISAYELGKSTPTLLTAYAITEALGITLHQLVAEKVVIEI